MSAADLGLRFAIFSTVFVLGISPKAQAGEPKNRSRSMTRSRSCRALVALSAASTVSPRALEAMLRLACAMANLGSISGARWKNGMAAGKFAEELISLITVLYALRASSDGVVPSPSGVVRPRLMHDVKPLVQRGGCRANASSAE